MEVKRVASGLILVLGIIGIFASVISIPDPAIRKTFLIVCSLVTLSAAYLFVTGYIDIWTAAKNLATIRRLRIRRIHSDGTSANALMRHAIRNSKSVRIMAVSGGTLIEVLRDELIYALSSNSASLRVLLATANSEFVPEGGSDSEPAIWDINLSGGGCCEDSFLKSVINVACRKVSISFRNLRERGRSSYPTREVIPWKNAFRLGGV